MPALLSSAAKIRRWPVRVALEGLYFCFTGADLVVTIAAMLALAVGYLPINDASVRTLADGARALSPLLFLAVVVRASFLTGRIEGGRSQPAPIVFTRTHIEKMNEVARQIRQRIQWYGTTEYYAQDAPAGTRDLVASLTSHFSDLGLQGWDEAASRLELARDAIRAQAKEVGDLGRLDWLVLEAVETGVAPTLEWAREDASGKRWLALKTANIGRFLDVTAMTEDDVEGYQSKLQAGAAAIVASHNAQQAREVRASMESQRKRLLDRLREISQVDALPTGTRCALCDPRP